MAYFSRKSKVDANHPTVVDELKKMGYTVTSVAPIKGFVDIVVGARGFNFLFEIKDPAQPPSKRRLTEDEQKFHDTWRGQKAVILTAQQAHEIIEETLRHYALF